MSPWPRSRSSPDTGPDTGETARAGRLADAGAPARNAAARPGPAGAAETGSAARGGLRAEVGKRDRAVGAQPEARVVSDLPDVAVRVPEIAGVPAVERFSRCLRYLRSRARRAGQQLINLGP